jgi:hypothetical protein
MKTNRIPLLLFSLLLSLLVTGCGSSNPTKDEVLNHLNASLNVAAPYQLTDIKPDFLPQGDGTVTVKGSLTGKLKDDLYERADYLARIKELGYDDAAWKNSVRDAQMLREPYRSTLMSQIPSDFQNHPELTLIKLATRAGSDVHFNFQTIATKGQTGWTFSDDQIVPTDMPPGSPEASYGSDALIEGSDAEKSQDQAYVSKVQTFIKATDDSKKAIAAEDEKTRQTFIAATADGKSYVGTFQVYNGSWPLGLSFTDQQQIGTGVSIKGYIFDPDNPSHKKDFAGTILFDQDQAQGQPIRFTAVNGSGIDPAICRPNNFTDANVQGGPDHNYSFYLALDNQGNLSGRDWVGHVDFAPKQ